MFVELISVNKNIKMVLHLMNIHYSIKCPCSDSVNLSLQSKHNTGWWSYSALYIKAPTYYNLVPTTHFDKRSGVNDMCFEDF